MITSQNQDRSDPRDVRVSVVGNPEVPCLDLVVDIRTVDTRTPYEVADIQGTVDTRDMVDNQPCAVAFRTDFRSPAVAEGIQKVLIHPVEEIRRTHEAEAADNRNRDVVVVHLVAYHNDASYLDDDPPAVVALHHRHRWYYHHYVLRVDYFWDIVYHVCI